MIDYSEASTETLSPRFSENYSGVGNGNFSRTFLQQRCSACPTHVVSYPEQIEIQLLHRRREWTDTLATVEVVNGPFILRN